MAAFSVSRRARYNLQWLLFCIGLAHFVFLVSYHYQLSSSQRSQLRGKHPRQQERLQQQREGGGGGSGDEQTANDDDKNGSNAKEEQKGRNQRNSEDAETSSIGE